MSEKGFVSKKNLSRAWNRLFGKVLNSKEEIEANTSENMIAGAEAVKEVYSSLTANGSQLCMDYHDGKYGVNTDPQRGADTFIPFHSCGNYSDKISIVVPFKTWYNYTFPQKPKTILAVIYSTESLIYIREDENEKIYENNQGNVFKIKKVSDNVYSFWHSYQSYGSDMSMIYEY